MKAALFALAASAAVGQAAASVHKRHGALHHLRRNDTPYVPEPEESCVCRTYVTTIYGEPTLVPVHTPKPEPETKTEVEVSTVYVVPTPVATTCETPGTYTMTAATITLTSATTVCVETSAVLTPGKATYGGYTTTVTEATTVTCPYATVVTDGSTTTTTIKSTTYVCPSAGTYTIHPTTTDIAEETTCVYPVPTEYEPGTYEAPEQTVTITKTSEVYVCAYTSVGKTEHPEPTYTPEPEVHPEPEEEEPEPEYHPEPEKEPEEEPKEVHKEEYKEEHKEEHKEEKTSYHETNGNKWAMTYTPYTSEGSCKTSSEVDSDVAIIAKKGFKAVRVYGTDCSGLENIGAACEKHGMQMIIGVFIDGSGIPKANEQVEHIISWGKWELVAIAVIGNEAVFNGYCSSAELAGFIAEVKERLRAAGYTGPCTTTEPLGTLKEASPELCSVVDIVGANLQPYFNPEVTADQAGDFVARQLEEAKGYCPGKEVYSFETGWPNGGNPNGKAVPGKTEQEVAMHAIIEKVGKHTVVFSFGNDGWKEPGQYNVENHFGCADVFSDAA